MIDLNNDLDLDGKGQTVLVVDDDPHVLSVTEHMLRRGGYSTIAVSGLTFYTGDKFPRWKNNLFVGGMRQGEVPRSGQLVRLDFNDKWEELHRESMFHELQNRIRDVRQGPDGLLYVLTEEQDGALLKMEPWAAPGPGR